MDSKDSGQGAVEESNVNYSSLNDDDRAPVSGATSSAATAPLAATVQVVSPADLPEGYQFSVVGEKNRTLVVEVPEGGVRQQQRFTARVLYESSLEEKPPLGKWRDGLFDCFDKGLCHPHVCLAYWCPPIALGQVLTRLRLDWFGSPVENPSANGWSTFKVITALYLVFLLFHYAVALVTQPYGLRGKEPEETTWSRILDSVDDAVSIVFGLYMLVVVARARGHVRSKYNIPERDCAGCEDCCFSYFCRCCVVAQMARHINDYDRYSADCCSETGVAASAPELV